MSLLDYFLGTRKKTASVAKERLQLILAHERAADAPDFLPALQAELLAVIGKYIPVDQDKIKVTMERRGDYEVLELNILFPDQH
ncbi:MAG: cell division topological specificity factor MinE [Acidithiobacillus sp.]|jgi:cell division topological specificity factor|uniref:Cell division topological specificity factor n=3 Tax=Acidithiobacillus TaxID=119977 RepID=A0A3M8R888_9PROT|nr:cell division topological specificity factor MinE [Acidithiobacillus sulfuriphilus]MCL5980324.1 cell division topological specificity factor MinE [Gammaproteobacteria bacterium]OYV80904.1 MAG: cell division topological specificity factor MinE [Acidithiobacillus ferrivorans]RNF64777.1 cell division topological specificity factor MinE [Acidithiobacillus sulfuriphilus]